MDPNINHYVVYETAVFENITFNGASWPSLRFANIVLVSPAVVIEKKTYDPLKITLLFMMFDDTIN